jgi:lysophospholipase L1-like esterase
MQAHLIVRALKRAALVITTLGGLGVATVGVPSAATAAPIAIGSGFTWSLAQMTTDNMVDGGSLSEARTSPVTLNGCGPSGVGIAATYEWTFASGAPTLTTTACSTTWLRPVSPNQHVETVTLTVTPFNRLRRSSSTGTIAFRDVVIASLGDSAASGEGAKGSGPWLEPTCHRSRIAGSAQAAARAQQALGSAVTVHFWFLACSGAHINDGLLAPYLNQQAQLTRLSSLISQSGLSPNRVLMTIGANDLHWSEAAKDCLPLGFAPFPSQEICVATKASQMNAFVSILPGTFTILHSVMATMPVNPSNVFLTDYFDPIDSQLPQQPFCGPEPEAGWVFRQFAADSVFKPLQRIVMGAATGGWHLVSGIGNAFQFHGICQPTGLRWINNSIDSLIGQGDLNGLMHANAMGQAVVADYVYNAIIPGL